MIRKAELSDIDAIAATYTSLLQYEQAHGSNSHWVLGVYPTRAVPEAKVPTGTMYVLEDEAGQLCASMILNQEQAPEYDLIPWQLKARREEVFVIHTLCIPPQQAGKGYGRQMVEFAKAKAREAGCSVMRIDTHAENFPAQRLYKKLGFTIAGYGPAMLNGLLPLQLVFLECEL